tara:strand:- start:834 stop:1154 length:321 start_codon:yes stop_codon:yes gene_type:complete
MIPFIRSISELRAITASRDSLNNHCQNFELGSIDVDSGQRKRYLRSIEKKEISLPDLPKAQRHKWLNYNNALSRFLDDLDYQNNIQSTFDLTLIGRQHKNTQKDVA